MRASRPLANEWVASFLVLTSLTRACAQVPWESTALPMPCVPPLGAATAPGDPETPGPPLSDPDFIKDHPSCPPTDLNPSEPGATGEKPRRHILSGWLRKLLGRLFHFARRQDAEVTACPAPPVAEVHSSRKPHLWPPAHYTIAPGELNLDVPLGHPIEMTPAREPINGGLQLVPGSEAFIPSGVIRVQARSYTGAPQAVGSTGSATKGIPLLGWVGSVPPSLPVTVADLREERAVGADDLFAPSLFYAPVIHERAIPTLASPTHPLACDFLLQTPTPPAVLRGEVSNQEGKQQSTRTPADRDRSARWAAETKRPFWTRIRLCAVPLAVTGVLALILARRRPPGVD
jgi:hypothetical protein